MSIKIRLVKYKLFVLMNIQHIQIQKDTRSIDNIICHSCLIQCNALPVPRETTIPNFLVSFSQPLERNCKKNNNKKKTISIKVNNFLNICISG